MEPFVSSRVSRMGLSATFAILDSVRDLRARGLSIIDLNGGEPNFDTPEHIVHAAKQALDAGITHYTESRGDPELVQAIARKLCVDNGIDVDGRQIIVTPSAKHALFVSLTTIVDPGDEVIVLTPAWVSYRSMVELLGGRVVEVPVLMNENCSVDVPALRAAISSRTRAILLNTPNNPTGHVLTRVEAQKILDIAIEHNLFVVADEIYEKIVYPGYDHFSIGSLPNAAERVITVNGFSKAYAMTGWRIGYLSGSAHFIGHALKVQQHTVGCANAFVQRAAVEALNGPQQAIADMTATYAGRRTILVSGLTRIHGVKCHAPDGSFYVFADLTGVASMSSLEWAQWLLKEARVAATPGSAFGAGGEGFIRFSFATSDEELHEAVRRMGASIEKLRAIAVPARVGVEALTIST